MTTLLLLESNWELRHTMHFRSLFFQRVASSALEAITYEFIRRGKKRSMTKFKRICKKRSHGPEGFQISFSFYVIAAGIWRISSVIFLLKLRKNAKVIFVVFENAVLKKSLSFGNKWAMEKMKRKFSFSTAFSRWEWPRKTWNLSKFWRNNFMLPHMKKWLIFLAIFSRASKRTLIFKTSTEPCQMLLNNAAESVAACIAQLAPFFIYSRFTLKRNFDTRISVFPAGQQQRRPRKLQKLKIKAVSIFSETLVSLIPKSSKVKTIFTHQIPVIFRQPCSSTIDGIFWNSMSCSKFKSYISIPTFITLIIWARSEARATYVVTTRKTLTRIWSRCAMIVHRWSSYTSSKSVQGGAEKSRTEQNSAHSRRRLYTQKLSCCRKHISIPTWGESYFHWQNDENHETTCHFFHLKCIKARQKFMCS